MNRFLVPIVLGLSLVTVADPAFGDDAAPNACSQAIRAAGQRLGSWTKDRFASLSPEALSGESPSAGAAVARTAITASCAGDDRATQALSLLDSSAKLAEAMVAEERACRAAPRCMTERAKKAAEAAAEATFAHDVALSICEATWNIENAKADIARERANPSGVVDLIALHQAGQAVQSYQDQIRVLTPTYVARRHHAFRGWTSEPVCIDAYDASMAERGCKRVDNANGTHTWNCDE